MKNKKIKHGGASPHVDIRNPRCSILNGVLCTVVSRRKTQAEKPPRNGMKGGQSFIDGEGNTPDYQIVYDMIRGKRFISRFAPG